MLRLLGGLMMLSGLALPAWAWVRQGRVPPAAPAEMGAAPPPAASAARRAPPVAAEAPAAPTAPSANPPLAASPAEMGPAPAHRGATGAGRAAGPRLPPGHRPEAGLRATAAPETTAPAARGEAAAPAARAESAPPVAATVAPTTSRARVLVEEPARVKVLE